MKQKKDEPVNHNISGRYRFALYALVFALGAQTMILELALPRLLAPAFGNTLFCWTAAIGLVLAALAIGYHLGGELSSPNFVFNTPSVWSVACLSAVFVCISGILGDKIVSSISSLGMIIGPLVGTFLLAVPSAGIGAAVLPISVSLISKQKDSGLNAGRLYAFSTIGSVIGVLVTGYLLLPLLGVAGSLLVAASLVFAVFIFGNRLVLGLIGLVCIFCTIFLMPHQRDDNVLLDKSNGYHRIKVISEKNNDQIRLLFLDSSLEGAVMLGNKNPGIPYQRKGAILASKLPNAQRYFFLGGGSFSIPRYIKSQYPGAQIDVAEIDRDVVITAEDYFELPDDAFNVFIGDARRILAHSTGQYDLVMNDAFHGLRNIPFHLATRQFHQLVESKLSSTGVYAVNVMGNLKQSRLINSMIKTLRQDFHYVNLIVKDEKDIDNFWILASDAPINIGEPATYYEDKAITFTDNHAPVEYLIAFDLAQEKL